VAIWRSKSHEHSYARVYYYYEKGKKNMKTNTDIQQRIKNLFHFKEFAKLQAILITSQPNIFYFSNFTGHDSWLILTPRKTTLITDGRYTLQAEQECPQARIVVRSGSIVDEFAKVVDKLALKKIGFFAEDMSVGLLNKLSAASKRLHWQALASTFVSSLRQIKSPDEIHRMKKALMIAEEAFTGLIEDLKPGVTENQVAAELEYRMRMLGAETASYDTIVASGANAPKPHARTSDAKIVPGKSIVFDFGALADGYCSDLTRTIYLGKMPPAFKDVYKVCLEAQVAAIQTIRPGIRASEVDAVARTIITKAGFGQYFNHGTGHGLGLEVHEQPVLNRLSDQILQPGMVVTVEPGIYLPGKGGVRIEDDVLVTQKGFAVLSSLPKEPDQVLR